MQHYAAERLHIATIRELLAAGASATVTDKFGDTPLHCCCRGWEPGKKDQCSAAATALLEAGASPTASNKRGETPLTMAGGQSVPQLERLLERAHSAQMRKLGKSECHLSSYPFLSFKLSLAQMRKLGKCEFFALRGSWGGRSLLRRERLSAASREANRDL